MSDVPPPQFNTLREAYCAVYKCPAAEFEKRVFWKCLFPHAWPLAHWMWWFEREFFRPDLEGVRAMGAARCEADLERAIDDLGNLVLVERSIRRGTLMIRLSPNRLIKLLRPLLPLLKPVTVVAMTTRIAASSAILTPRGMPASAPATARARADGGTQTLRKLKRLHSQVVAGRPLAEALREEGWTEEDLEVQLAGVGEDRLELVWLREYLAMRRELQELRTENARLKTSTAADGSPDPAAGSRRQM